MGAPAPAAAPAAIAPVVPGSREERFQLISPIRRRIAEHPDNVPMINNAAWFLAVRPPPGIDPAECLRLAEQACALAGDAHAGVLDTLAAALATNGRFDEAAQAAERAQQTARAAGADALAEQIGRRLETYRRGQPWRE